MIKLHVNAMQTPDSIIKSPIFQCLQGPHTHNTDPTRSTGPAAHTQRGIFFPQNSIAP